MSNADIDMGEEAIHPNNAEPVDNADNADDADEDVNPEEYKMLDAKLDDLNIALDLMEQKNDHIRAEFLKLLHSNKQIREELKQENPKAMDAGENAEGKS